MNKASWQDVKGAMVLAGTYEEAVKMMGDMNFLQVPAGPLGRGGRPDGALAGAGRARSRLKAHGRVVVSCAPMHQC